MKRIKNSIIGLVVMTSVVGPLAFDNAIAAEDGSKLNYAQIKMGAFKPTSGFDNAGYDTGFDGSIAYGRYLTKHLILEGAIDGSLSRNKLSSANNTIGDYSQKNDIGVTAFLLTLKEEYSIGHFNLYGGGGIGAYYANLYSKVDTNRFGTFNKDESDTVFGAHLVAGANYDITQNWFLGLEGTYRWTGKVKINGSAATVPVTYNDDLNGYTIAASVGYRF